MADRIAALIVDLQADTTSLVQGTKTAATALDSLDQYGVQTVTTLDMMRARSEGAADSMGGLTNGLRQADKVLAEFGINLSSEIHALDELGQASGKTASEIGLIGTAALAAGAAMGGWKIGRAVAEFFDLDRTIANGTARLMGWGDVAAEEAGAKADVLARASQIAGHEITTLSEAMAINEKHANRFKQSALEAAEAEKAQAKATEEVHKALSKSLEETTRRQAEAAEAAKRLAEQIANFNAEQFRQVKALEATFRMIPGELDPVLKKENELGVVVDEVTQRTTAAAKEFADAQSEWARETNNGLVIIGEVAPAVEDMARSGGDAVERMTGKWHGLAQAAQSALQVLVPAGFSFEQAFTDAGLIVHNSIGGLRPFATGGIVTGPTAALIGEAGPEAVIPLDRAGSFGTRVENHFHIGTFVGSDRSAARELARMVGDEQLRASGRKFSVG